METTVVPIASQQETLKGAAYSAPFMDEQVVMRQDVQQRQQLLHNPQLVQQQQTVMRIQQRVLQQEQQECANEQPDQQQPQKQQQQAQQQLQHAQQQQQYSTCGGEDGVLPAGPLFVEKMSLLMEQLATCGEESSRRPNVTTRFDSVCAPATSIATYIPRLYRHFRCSEEVFVFALIYLDRVIRANNIKINALNIHRLVLAASVIGVKFVEDVRYSNRYYARVGGVGLAELNRLELAFLKLVKFDLTVSKEEYAVYRSTVLLACPKPRSLPEPAVAEQQQQKQQKRGAAEGPASMQTDSAESESSAPASKQAARFVSDPTEEQKLMHLLMQQHHQKGPKGFNAISTASTVSATPEASGALRGAAQEQYAQQHQQDEEAQQDSSEVSLQRQAQVLLQQEEALRWQLEQQRQQIIEKQFPQWSSARVQMGGAAAQSNVALQQQHGFYSCLGLCSDTNAVQQKLCKHIGELPSNEKIMELHQQQRQLFRAQQLLLLREYHQQQHLLLEQQQQQQLQLLRQQQQLMLQENELLIKDASMSPSNSCTPTLRSSSRDSLSFCGGTFGLEPDEKMTTASDEELPLASPMMGLRAALAAEVP